MSDLIILVPYHCILVKRVKKRQWSFTEPPKTYMDDCILYALKSIPSALLLRVNRIYVLFQGWSSKAHGGQSEKILLIIIT